MQPGSRSAEAPDPADRQPSVSPPDCFQIARGLQTVGHIAYW